MFKYKNKKILYYRIWFTVLLILTAVFGAALIIYEDWQIEQDRISKYIPYQDIIWYMHLREPLSSEYLGLAKVINENFGAEYEDLKKFDFRELSFLLYQQDRKDYSGWFLYDRDDNFDYSILAENWHAHKIDKIVVISSSWEFIERFKNYKVDHDNSIKKYLSNYKVNRGIGNFLYWNIDKNYELSGSLANVVKNKISGEWLVYSDKNNLAVEKLPKKSVFQLPFFHESSRSFVQNFSDANILVMNHNLEQNKNVFNSQDYLLEIIKPIEDKYNFNIFNILSKTKESHDLALYLSENRANDNRNYLWIGRGMFTKQGFMDVHEIMKTRMGWQMPTEETVVLPDSTEIIEFKVMPVDFEYQTANISGKIVNVVYFNKDSYFIWFKDGDFTVLGNSMKLINRYILQTKAGVNNKCVENSSELIKLDANFSKNLVEAGVESIFIGKNNSKFDNSYLICTE